MKKLIVLVLFVALGIWLLTLYPDPGCVPWVAMRGAPYSIQWHECQTEKRREQ